VGRLRLVYQDGDEASHCELVGAVTFRVTFLLVEKVAHFQMTSFRRSK
jgi:hypothetical protein